MPLGRSLPLLPQLKPLALKLAITSAASRGEGHRLESILPAVVEVSFLKLGLCDV